MSLTVSVEAKGVTAVAVEAFHQHCAAVHGALSEIGRSVGIPQVKVSMILTDDFIDVVRRLTGNHSFAGQRVGGTVLAKCLPQKKDYSDVIVVMDALALPGACRAGPPEEEVERQMLQIYLIAHELAHPLLHRARSLAGAPDVDVDSPLTEANIARCITQLLVDEYRADLIGDAVLRVVLQSYLGDGNSIGAWDMLGQAYMERLAEALAEAHPLWPDMVQRYREHEIDLMSMWDEVCTSVKETLVLLTHTQALADSTGQPSVLETEALAALPAVRLYLQRPWGVFAKAFRDAPILPAVDLAHGDDSTLVAAGEDAVRQIWSTLGLTLEDRSDGQFAIWVKAPIR